MPMSHTLTLMLLLTKTSSFSSAIVQETISSTLEKTKSAAYMTLKDCGTSKHESAFLDM